MTAAARASVGKQDGGPAQVAVGRRAVVSGRGRFVPGLPAGSRSSPGSPAAAGRLRRCACGGGCPRCKGAARYPKLAVNVPGDAFEREADRIADAVMAGGPAAAPARSAMPTLRRCGCGGDCPSCRKRAGEDGELRRDDAGAGSTPGFAPPVVHHVLATPGRPLEASTRGSMEQRFGADFGSVRVHDDARAAESARAVDAHAYAVGNHIVFAAGRYTPGTPAGDRMLAHELAHTLQGDALGLHRQEAGGGGGVPIPPDPRTEPPEPPENGIVIDLLDPLNSSLRIGGFGLPSPRDVLNGLDRLRRFGQPPPTPTNPLPPSWPVPPLTPEETRRAACRALPGLCLDYPGTPTTPRPTLPRFPRLVLKPPLLQPPRLIFHAHKVLDHFIYDQTGVPDRHRGELDRTATELMDNPPLVTDITGHTDTHGDPGYNQRLSQRRASSIRDYLLDRRVPQLQIWSVTGLGESQPRFPNDTTDWLAAARNRRVELDIRRLVWRLTLLPGPGLRLGPTPTLAITDPRPRVLPADRARFDRLRTFLTTARGEITRVLAQNPPHEPWAVPDNENITAMLTVLDELNRALVAERHVVRFNLPTTGQTAASYQFLQDEIELRPFSTATEMHEVASSLVHEYTHHEQDVTAEQLLRARRLPLEHSREDELRQETEARRNEVYFERLIGFAGHRLSFHTDLNARLFLGRFERERTGSPSVQAAARREIRTELAGPYAGQLAANAPSRGYLIEIRSNRHAVLVGMRGAETDLGAVPTTITTQQALEGELSTRVDALPGRAALFRGPRGQRLVVIQFVVFDAGRKVAEFGLRP